MLSSVCSRSETSLCLSLNLWCAGFSPRPLPPSSDRLPSKDVMGCGEEAKFNHYSSHDRSTNAAIQQRVSLKQSMFHCACASCVLLSHEHFLKVIPTRKGIFLCQWGLVPQKCSFYLPALPEFSGENLTFNLSSRMRISPIGTSDQKKLQCVVVNYSILLFNLEEFGGLFAKCQEKTFPHCTSGQTPGWSGTHFVE